MRLRKMGRAKEAAKMAAVHGNSEATGTWKLGWDVAGGSVRELSRVRLQRLKLKRATYRIGG